jgi:hypothetical protein
MHMPATSVRETLALGKHQYAMLSDEELAEWGRWWRRREALAREEQADAYPTADADELDSLTRSLRDYAQHHIGLIRSEMDRRRLAARRGVPLDRRRFPPDYLDRLRRAVPLDRLLEEEMAADLDPPNRRGERRGPCPVCHAGRTSGNRPFVVHTADPGDQWCVCFACEFAADAIGVMQASRSLVFREAVAHLVARALLAEWEGVAS